MIVDYTEDETIHMRVDTSPIQYTVPVSLA
jgi:hypothetical protein